MKTILAILLLLSLTNIAFATAAKKQAIIRITAPSGYTDATTVYFDYGVNPAFVANQDAPKVFSTITGEPAIFSMSSDSVKCSINGYSTLASGAIIPIGIKIDVAGAYLFTPAMLSKFDSTTIVILEDRQEHVSIDLVNNFYSVQLTDTGITTGRFFLHVSSAMLASPVTAGCANNDGAINVSGDASILWTNASLYTNNDSLITELNNVSGTFFYSNLPEGDYRLVLYYAGLYVSTMPVHVNGNYVVAHIQSLPLSASVNQEITFHALDLNATNCFWDFGDGSQINGITNPTFAFLQPGVFTVLLKCTNTAGCQYSDSVTITVVGYATSVNNVNNDSRNVWANAKTITVVLNEDVKPGAELKIYNLLGQPVYESPITELTSIATLNNETDGYYIVSVLNNNVNSTKSVMLLK